VSSSSPEKLVYMANQIARFFVAQPGDTAALRIADHLTAFWVPSMRHAIIAHLDAGGEGLLPAAAEAVRVLKQSSSDSVERQLAAAGEPSPGHQQGDDAG